MSSIKLVKFDKKQNREAFHQIYAKLSLDLDLLKKIDIRYLLTVFARYFTLIYLMKFHDWSIYLPLSYLVSCN